MNRYWIRIRRRKAVQRMGGLLLIHFFILSPLMGTIVYIPDQGFTLEEEIGPFQGEVWMAGSDFALRFGLGLDEWQVSQQPFSPGGVLQLLGEGSDVANLDSGFELRDGLDWRDAGGRNSSLPVSHVEPGGLAFFDTTGYLGVRIHGEASEPYYGWLRLEHSLADATYTVHDWAWNRVPGESIQAGEIPEPAVFALILGLGVLGVVLWRKRKRHDGTRSWVE